MNKQAEWERTFRFVDIKIGDKKQSCLHPGSGRNFPPVIDPPVYAQEQLRGDKEAVLYLPSFSPIASAYGGNFKGKQQEDRPQILAARQSFAVTPIPDPVIMAQTQHRWNERRDDRLRLT